MEKPRIRWVEAHPATNQGMEMILLRDPENISEKHLLVSKDTVFLLSLMDGTRTVREIQVEYMRAYGELLYIERIQEVVDAMDENLLLFNDNYRNHFTKLKEQYENEPVRRPFLAGKSYPDNRMDLLTFLDDMFSAVVDGEQGGEVTGILAPHIDYARGIDVYRETYKYLKQVQKPLLIVFGTAHYHTEKILNISVKDFSTPLDTIPNSKHLCRLISADDVLKNYISEWPHRSEHSIELQLPLIQFMLPYDFEMLPILTGSMQEYIEGVKSCNRGELASILERLTDVLKTCGQPYVIVAGADLAHIGAQFGDRYKLDAFTLTRSQQKDEALLQSIREVNADKFFELIKEEKDERRICGLTPIYLQLKLLEKSSCRIVDYRQWTDNQSSVSFAGGVFYKD